MAEYTYQTRYKITQNWIAHAKKKGKNRSAWEEKLLPEMSNYSIPTEPFTYIKELLNRGVYETLRELYQGKLSNLVKTCVPESMTEEFYDALDQMNQFQMTEGWFRRSVRSQSYQPFIGHSIRLLWAYSRLDFYGVSLAQLLTGQAEPEMYDHARTVDWNFAGILAAKIDRGDLETIQAVEDILMGEGNTLMISNELIRGIVMSQNKGLYETLGKFLLAARLQEGARQAVCETMDAGRPEAFLHLFGVIEEHNLIRYSSVKRAVSTWIGIFNEKSVDRITDKLVRLMGQCLRDEKACREQLESNDSIAISCGLWALGFYDADKAIQAMQKLIHEGTKNQKMTASYFNNSLQYHSLKRKAAKEVIVSWPEDLELVACFLPGFMDHTNACLGGLLTGEDGTGSPFYGKIVKPDKISTADMFDCEEEARTIYGLFRNMLKQIPKKGLDLNPCIFPWHRVTMTQSDLAIRMCLIAWMLQDERYLDEAAKLIPMVGQGETYGASRSVVARVLLYRPKSQVRREVLFELLHNPEERTMQSAYLLVEDMDLTEEDYSKIEENLKYKKGRTGVLALLGKQERSALLQTVGRLLASESEECRMGALDLALQMKREDPENFTAVKPVLQALTEPTGREQVLLDELLGERSAAQDILNTPGYGLYDTKKEWILPPVTVDEKQASKLFVNGEGACIRILKSLDQLIEEKKNLEYKTVWGEEAILGTALQNSCHIHNDPKAKPLDALPFGELWENFYRKEIKTPEMLLELYLYQVCRGDSTQGNFYGKNTDLYKKVFGSGFIKKPPFKELILNLQYGRQIGTVINTLYAQFVPSSLRVRWGLVGTAKLLSILDKTNALRQYEMKRWDGANVPYTMRMSELPIFNEMRIWLSSAEGEDWGSAFTLRFQLQELYRTLKEREKRQYNQDWKGYLNLSDYVQCYVKGIWNKDLFYKAVFRFMDMASLLGPVSTVEQKGAVSFRNAYTGDLYSFFGQNAIQPVDGKYYFDQIGDENPAMKLAHEIYAEIVPLVLAVELKRGEQATPFSGAISSIRVIYGIDRMIQILTVLGKDTLRRSTSYYSVSEERKSVLSHLLKVCRPKPGETAADLKKALKGTDITKKRLVEVAMYAQQWIPLLEEYFQLPGFQSGCYYFMAHTSEGLDELTTAIIARFTPLTPEELRDGAFDLNWFFEAYHKLGEKEFGLLYDAAKYSSTGIAHARSRKYADAALGKVEKEALKAEISEKRNKDLLMSLGLLPFDGGDEDILDRYQFIQKYLKESKNFGAQRRASEGRAAALALQNLSVNAGFTDVTRLTLRMENRLVETMNSYFEWAPLGEVELKIFVDENGKSSIQCSKGGKLLKSIPAKYKKDETLLEYQEVNKKLKEQYSRTRQMMEQAMEDRTAFEVWEFLELLKNPVVKPVAEPLVVMAAADTEAAAPDIRLGFLTEQGLMDWSGSVTILKKDEKILIAHPSDFYRQGHWHEYQKLLFDKQMKQPFKQVFRELYVKLSEELDKDDSRMFAGNQIQPQKTVGALRSRRWVADYEEGLQKIYYKENIVARIYAMADWFSPSDVEAPTLEYVVFSDRKTFETLKIREIPEVLYSEVMRDVDLAVSVAHAGGVDPETSHSTVEMRKAIVECNLELFKIKNVRLEGSHALIDGKLGQYTVHLGSGVVHQMGNSMLFVVPVHSQQRGRIFLPFVDDDPKTAEILSKILLFAEDTKIKDPSILKQIG